MSRRAAAAPAVAAVGLLALTGSVQGAATVGPALLSQPQVTGVARAGARLTAGTGSWSGAGTIRYAYRWVRCSATGNSCATIAGAAGASYAPGTADVGRTVGLTVNATDDTGSAASAAALVGPVAPAAARLASTVRPVVSGAAVAGSTLAVSAGTWTSAPSALAYSWLRCDAVGRACVPIAKATGATYVAAAADVGHVLVARVQATAGRAVQAVLGLGSAPVATPSGTIGRPAIAGVAQVGRRLAGAPPPGAPAGAAVAYQWYRCDGAGAHCSSVHGATGRSYLTTVRDAAHTIGLTTRVGTGAAATPAYSSLLGPIAPAAAAGASTAQPAVTGTALEGRRLSAAPGTWSPPPGSVAYAWQRCNENARVCEPIDDATSVAYTPVSADVGHTLVALVVARFGSATETAFSLATAPVRPAVLGIASAPGAAGTLKVGSRLTASPGLWTGAPPIVYRYQWSRCDAAGAHCSSVHGATAGTYRLVAADAGHTVALAVTASDGAAAQTAYAGLVGPVAATAATFVSTAQPGLSGSPVVGATLSADAGGWSAAPAATSYQWQRCNPNGRVCEPIAAATSSTYVATADDVGHALVAIVTARAGAASAAAWSTPSRAVRAAAP